MKRPFFAPEAVGLQTDFYLLVLAAVYHADGMWGEATFDLYARQLPEGYGYLVVGGIHEAIEGALKLSFTPKQIAWLKEVETFQRAPEAFWGALEHLRFEGEIHAAPEGSVVFPGEPILRVTAPLIQATLLETRLVQAVSHGVAIATRAARLTDAAGGRRIHDFGSRRLPGQDAALLAARAAMVGGFAGTTNTLAAAVLDAPVMGTLSAGFMAAYPSDGAALEAFRVHFPDVGYVELPQPDVVQAVIELARHRRNIRIVRLDHWDLGRVARRLRGALDASGMDRVRILGSGKLDEHRVRELTERNDPVDMLAIGSHLTASPPQAGVAYRMAEIWQGPDPLPVTHKGGSLYPGVKQVYRCADHDLIALVEEAPPPDCVPLLEPVVLRGERIDPVPPVAVSSALRAQELARLSPELRELGTRVAYPVRVSERLAATTLG
ncbi:MAG: nicotinate phosphoribosyltransferase [Alphaproteobacteria bacterium]|nr:nicotinate phosphoribosyltransferase [Alphaproteobacteria bacterium]